MSKAKRKNKKELVIQKRYWDQIKNGTRSWKKKRTGIPGRNFQKKKRKRPRQY